MKRLFLSLVAVLSASILQAQETFTTSGVQLTEELNLPLIVGEFGYNYDNGTTTSSARQTISRL